MPDTPQSQGSPPVESNTPAAPAPSRGRKIIRVLMQRAYAAVILAVVLWTGYTAVAYLHHSVFQEAKLPAQIAESNPWSPPTSAPSDAPTPPGRSYHDADNIFADQPRTGCLTTGCHTAPPHAKRKEMRAFANMHTTFLTCGMCHAAKLTDPIEATWINRKSGKPTDPPAALRLMTALDQLNDEAMNGRAEPTHDALMPLVQAVTEWSDDAVLHRLMLDMDTSQPGSPVWRQAVKHLRVELPEHIRGHYAGVLTPTAMIETASADQARLERLAASYLAAQPESTERKQLHDEIHDDVIAQPKGCIACHGGESARLDFTAVGYSPARAEALRNAAIAAMTQNIMKGEPFHLPTLLEDPHAQ